MERIIAVGDSNTFGEHLEGLNLPKDYPSGYAWPSILGQLTNLPVVNLAIPGSGLKTIWNNINQFNFQSEDHLIILYPPEHQRIDIIQKSKIDRLRIYDKRIESTTYFKYIYNRHNEIIDNYLIMDHINYTFLPKLKNVIHILYGYIAEMHDPEIIHVLKKYKNLRSIKLADFDMAHMIEVEYPNDRAFDNAHPGKLIHEEFAKKIYKNYFIQV